MTLFLTRRLSLGLLALAVLPALAQTAPFPGKPVTIITPFPAGSGPDAVLRMTSEKLAKIWGQTVTVDNKPGGAGFIAFDIAKRAAPDGYTLLQMDSDHLGALPHLFKSRNFEPLKTFQPVGTFFRTYFLVAVGTESKWKNMNDLIGAAKAAPDKVTFGSWGVGSPGHMGAEYLELLTGVNMTHVPYREMSQLFSSVGANDVAWSFGSIPSSSGVFKAGKLRYLAVAAPKRLSQMPDVPTVQEAGGPAALDVNAFVILAAPRGVPAAVAEKIQADLRKAINEPDVLARFNTFAFEPIHWSTAEVEAAAAEKYRIYGELVKRKNISLD